MWKVYFFKTISGEIGPQVEPSSLSWSITLNGTEDLSMTVPKSELIFGDMRNFMEPWWGSILLAWDNTPVFAGPIVNRPEESYTTVSFQAQGIRALLARRSPTVDMNNWALLGQVDYIQGWNSAKTIGGPDLKASTFSLTNKELPSYRWNNNSYGRLARMAVEESITGKKRGGYLPIRFDHANNDKDYSDDKAVTDSKNKINPYTNSPQDRPHLLLFMGSDFTSVDSILTTITQRLNGPDILFIPKLDTKTFSIYWDMYTGSSEKIRTIPLDRPKGSELFWDITAPNTDISDFKVQYSGASTANRLFAQRMGNVGSIVFYEDQTKFNEGYPLLESNDTFQNATTESSFTSKSNSRFKGNLKPITQIDASIRTTETVNPPGSFWPGEIATIHVGSPENWLSLQDSVKPNGIISAKIMRISGNLSNNIDITFKESYTDDE